MTVCVGLELLVKSVQLRQNVINAKKDTCQREMMQIGPHALIAKLNTEINARSVQVKSVQVALEISFWRKEAASIVNLRLGALSVMKMDVILVLLVTS